jgi:hypothetical protein
MPLLPANNPGRLGLTADAFYLGFISLSIQVVYARLAVSFAGGNEVYLSLFFFLWLLFSGIGAVLIKSIKPSALFVIIGLVSILFGSVFFLAPKVTRSIQGQLISPDIYLFALIIALLPVCLVNGGLFASIAHSLKSEMRSAVTYFGEASGAFIGGLTTAAYFVIGGRDFSFIIFVGLIAFSRLFKNHNLIKIILIIMGLTTLIFKLGNPIENWLLRIRYKPFVFEKSCSGRLIRYDIVSTDGLLTLYSGGIKVADFPDEITGQEIFYWPYLIKPEMRNVTFIGADFQMVYRLVPARIEPLFVNPENSWRDIIPAQFLPPEKYCLQADPIAFFKSNKQKFDVIVINLGQLLSLYDYRLETRRFFNLCRESLADSGMLSVIVPAYDGLWRDDLKKRLNDIYAKLKSVFPDVGFIPGSNLTFLAGDKIIIGASEIIQRIDSLRIDSAYMTPPLVRSRLNSFIVNQVRNQLDAAGDISDRLAIGHGLSYYFSQLNFHFTLKNMVENINLLAIFCCLIAAAWFLGGKTRLTFMPLSNIIFFGMASFLFEILTFYRIQLLGGYLYIILGIIIGLFMAGMAVGAFIGTYSKVRLKMPKIINNGSTCTLLIFGILAGIILLTPATEFVLLVVNALAGFAGGLGYSSRAKEFDSRPGLPYGFDLGGAMLGTAIGLGILMATITVETVMIAIISLIIVLFATNRVLYEY